VPEFVAEDKFYFRRIGTECLDEIGKHDDEIATGMTRRESVERPTGLQHIEPRRLAHAETRTYFQKRGVKLRPLSFADAHSFSTQMSGQQAMPEPEEKTDEHGVEDADQRNRESEPDQHGYKNDEREIQPFLGGG
jgi:hypothetical protein